MTIRSSLALYLLTHLALGLISPPSARAAEPLSILGYTKSVSFWVDLPPGWRSDADAAKRTGAIFILLRSDTDFDTAPSVIVASAYEQTSLATAMKNDRASFLEGDPDIRIADRQPVVAKSGAQFLVREFRSQRLKQQGFELVAYHSEGPDVVVLTLSAQSDNQFREGQTVFGALLGSFEASKLKVKRVP